MSKVNLGFVGKMGRIIRNLVVKFGMRQGWQLLIGQATEPGWSVAERLQAAVDWLISSFHATHGQGFSTYYSLLSNWDKPFVETTGYIIPTILRFSELFNYRQAEIKEICSASGEWLLSVQHADGFFAGYDSDAPLIFNTGQVMRGLMALYRLNSDMRYLRAAQRAGDWLVINQEADGSWIKYAYNGVKHAYYSYADWSLVELGKLTGQASYRAAAIKHLDWVLAQQQSNGWFNHFGFKDEPKSVLHTIGYTLQGLIEAGDALGQPKYIEAAKRTADYLADLNEQQILFSFYDANWRSASHSRCLTGLAQMGVVWQRLAELYPDDSQHYRVAAQKVWNYLEERQITSISHPEIFGSLPGSIPLWGDYMPMVFPNWGVKFFIDLGLLIYRPLLPITLSNTPTKNVLLISYFFPPLQMFVGIMGRNLAKYLPQFGWQPLVVSAKSSREFNQDIEALRHVPVALPVYRTKVWENIFIRAMNRLGLVPDSMIGWSWFAVQAAKHFKRHYPISAIISRSNPITSHMVALWLVRWVMPGTPWIAIFGDPWAKNPYRSSRRYLPGIQKWHNFLERMILSRATVVILVSASTKQFMVDAPRWDNKIVVLPHAFDPQEIPTNPINNQTARVNGKLNFASAGSFYGPRSPEPLFKALKLLRETDPILASNIQVNLWGKLGRFASLLTDYDIQDTVIDHGQIPRAQVLTELYGSDALILIDAPSLGESIFLPAKLMDYLMVNRPILAITPPGESAKLIIATKTGVAVAPDDILGIATAIKNFYQLFRQNQLVVQPDPVELSKYSAINVTQRLAAILDRLTVE